MLKSKPRQRVPSPSPPPTRRAFRNRSDELDYNCEKAAHFLIEVGSRARARRYIERMRALLRGKPSIGSIGFATAAALVAEADCDWRRGCVWRRREASRLDRYYHTLRNRAELAYHAESWPWLALDHSTRRLRLVLRMYENAADPKETARVREAIQSIRWINL